MRKLKRKIREVIDGIYFALFTMAEMLLVLLVEILVAVVAVVFGLWLFFRLIELFQIIPANAMAM